MNTNKISISRGRTNTENPGFLIQKRAETKQEKYFSYLFIVSLNLSFCVQYYFQTRFDLPFDLGK